MVTAARGQRCAPTRPPPAPTHPRRCHLAPSSSKQKCDWPCFIVTGRKLILVSSGKGGRLHHFAFWTMSRLKSSRRKLSHLQKATRIKEIKVARGVWRKPVDSRGKESWRVEGVGVAGDLGSGELITALAEFRPSSVVRTATWLSDFYPPAKLKAAISVSWFKRVLFRVFREKLIDK